MNAAATLEKPVGSPRFRSAMRVDWLSMTQNRATNAIEEPVLTGGEVFHSTESRLTYHSGALLGPQ